LKRVPLFHKDIYHFEEEGVFFGECFLTKDKKMFTDTDRVRTDNVVCMHDYHGRASIVNMPRIIYAPYVCLDHEPLAMVEYAEVCALEEDGILWPCDGREIYKFQGQGIVVACSDPSLWDLKMAVLQRRGTFAPFIAPGIGLCFDPEGPLFDHLLLGQVMSFVDRTRGKIDVSRAFVVGAHYPCGYAQHANGINFSLRESCYMVARGACHIKKNTSFKVIATIFITTLMPDGSTTLLWRHIKKSCHKKGV